MNCVYLMLIMALQCHFILRLGAVEMDKLRVEEEERIVGGTLVNLAQFPWVVSLVIFKPEIQSDIYVQKFGKQCGGSIINELYILTAAHCFYKYKENTTYAESLLNLTHFRAIAGLTNLHLAKTSDLRTVTSLIIHSQFNTSTYLNDIALLKLEEKLTFNNVIQVIPVSYQWTGEGQLATTAGWGNTCNDNEDQFQLKYVTITTVAIGKCLGDGSVPARVSNINDTRAIICAGPVTRTAGGDSGGGLWMFNGQQSYLIGIVSHGVLCSNELIKVLPSLYTRLSNYQQFIEDNSRM